MKSSRGESRGFVRTTLTVVAGLGLALAVGVQAAAQAVPMQCSDSVPQDPTRIFRSGLWKQWIYWAIPGPDAQAAVRSIVAEVNLARAGAGLPLLIANPGYEIVLSVFEEKNARGKNGSSTSPTTSNQEAFLATFVDDAAGGFEVLFLADPMRSNDLLASLKGVPGVTATVERSMEFESEGGVDRIGTEWKVSTAAGDAIEFKAHYPGTAVYYSGFAPTSRIVYANCNVAHVSDIVFRSAPTTTYLLFSREEADYVDLTRRDVHVKARARHHDPLVNAIFNDPANQPEALIALDRDVRIESR